MFESFSFQAMGVAVESFLSFYSTGGITTGIVLSCGDGVIHTLPVYEGFLLPSAIVRLDFGGRDLTDYLVTMLIDKGHVFATTSEREFVREVKEQLCYINLDFREETKSIAFNNSIEENHKLSNGQAITVEKERFQCPEALFRPSLIGESFPGIHEAVYSSIMKCDIDARKDLYSNVRLCGGTTMFSGMAEKMKRELSRLAPSGSKVKIIAPPERKYGGWMGGSKLASYFLPLFQQICVSKQEYDESGPRIMHKKCF